MNSKDMNKTTICAQPWFGVVVRPNGSAGICCEVTDDLKGLDIRKNSFHEIQHHPKMDELRQQMLAGERPKECWRCWAKEDEGAFSLRQTLNQTYERLNGEFDPSLIKPQNVEFVLGNLCQLRCVMCHPARSKKIQPVFDHIINVEFRDSYKGLVTREPTNFDTSWVEDDATWDSLADQSVEAKRFFINGGEPLLAKQHEKVLVKLIEKSVAQDVELVYSTNGLLLTDKHLEMWKEFREVNISFSLDDLYDRNAFIRYPSDWNQVVKALDLVTKWQSDPSNANITVGIWCAVNLLSYAYMPEYLEFFATRYPNLRIRNLRAVQTPEYLSPANLPTPFKQRVMEEAYRVIVKYPQFDGLIDEFKFVVNTTPNPYLMVDGIAYMKRTAEFYGVDLLKVFPKMTEFLTHRNT